MYNEKGRLQCIFFENCIATPKLTFANREKKKKNIKLLLKNVTVQENTHEKL